MAALLTASCLAIVGPAQAEEASLPKGKPCSACQMLRDELVRMRL